MKNKIRKLILISNLVFLITLNLGCGKDKLKDNASNEDPPTIQEKESWTQDQKEVKATIERFLIVAGNYDLEAMKDMAFDIANLGVVRFQDNSWITYTLTFEEYFENAKNQELLPYFEPVREYKIQITDGQIAFVWADAILHRFGVPRSNNIDNFTLIKKDGQWKFINISFTKKPLASNEMKFDPEIFARSYAQAWSGKRPEFVAMYFAENGSLQVNDGEPATGRGQITEIAQGFMTDLPDMVVSYDSLVNKTNGTEFHWTLTATNTGPGGTGNKVRVSGFELWQLENGLIKKSQGNFPSEEYNRQLKFGSSN